MDFIDENYELSDEDKRDVFYIFNPEESCHFTTKEYYYTEFSDINERFCQVCYSEIAEEIKTYPDEHQNRLMQSLAKNRKMLLKTENSMPHSAINTVTTNTATSAMTK